jgi:hypothetical protein
MKRIIAGLVFILAGAAIAAGAAEGSAAGAAEGYRTFTDAEGRTVDAKILSFDAARGRLEIEREDGKRVRVEPGLFSEADQEYIKEWILADLALSDTNLRVSIKKDSEGSYGSKDELEEGEKMFYELDFNNRTDKPIEGLRIEYRYFITQKGTGDEEDKEVQVAGSTSLATIAARQSLKVNTDVIEVKEIYEEVRESNYTADGVPINSTSLIKTREDELDGIWVRIYGPTVGGIPMTRDVTYPRDLKEKKTWSKTVPQNAQQGPGGQNRRGGPGPAGGGTPPARGGGAGARGGAGFGMQ